jgi:hypothetical protein
MWRADLAWLLHNSPVRKRDLEIARHRRISQSRVSPGVLGLHKQTHSCALGRRGRRLLHQRHVQPEFCLEAPRGGSLLGGPAPVVHVPGRNTHWSRHRYGMPGMDAAIEQRTRAAVRGFAVCSRALLSAYLCGPPRPQVLSGALRSRSDGEPLGSLAIRRAAVPSHSRAKPECSFHAYGPSANASTALCVGRRRSTLSSPVSASPGRAR